MEQLLLLLQLLCQRRWTRAVLTLAQLLARTLVREVLELKNGSGARGKRLATLGTLDLEAGSYVALENSRRI
jgi:hypothetical protein